MLGSLGEPDPDPNAWDDLPRHTRAHPLLMQSFCLRRTGDGRVVVKPGRSKEIASIVVGALFIGVAYVASQISSRTGFAVTGAIALGLGVLTALSLLHRPKLMWSDADDRLRIQFGWWWPRIAIVPRQSLETALIIETADYTSDSLSRGVEHCVVVLRWIGSEGRDVRILEADYRRARALFDELAKMIGPERATDQTLTNLDSGGKNLRVSCAPVSHAYDSMSGMRLEFPTPDRAELWPLTKTRLIFIAIIVVTTVAMGFVLPEPIRKRDYFSAGIIGSVVVAFFVCGVLGAIFGMGYRKIVIDRSQRQIAMLGLPWATRRISMNDVAALQICTELRSSNDTPYKLFELNLVLSQPPGDRINLFAYRDVSELRRQARTLADLMSLPLLDHSRLPCDNLNARKPPKAHGFAVGPASSSSENPESA